jgi:hypothetical protein
LHAWVSSFVSSSLLFSFYFGSESGSYTQGLLSSYWCVSMPLKSILIKFVSSLCLVDLGAISGPIKRDLDLNSFRSLFLLNLS